MSVFPGGIIDDDVSHLVGEAVAAESERCAKIARESDRDPKALSIFQGVEIAAAILKPNK